MTMSIQNLATNQYGEEWYDPDFRIMIEDLLPELKSSNGTASTPTAQETAMYEGDFYGLLQAHGVEANLLWIVMRVNGYACTTDYAGEDIILFVPDRSQLDYYMDIFQTQKSRIV